MTEANPAETTPSGGWFGRNDRTRFVLFGLLPLANIAGILLYGLQQSTAGSGGGPASIPWLLVIVGIYLLMTMVPVIKRGCDLGLPAWLTPILFWFSIGLFIALPILLGAFAFMKSRPGAEKFGPAPEPAGVITWGWAFMNLVWPWVILGILAKVL